MKPRSKAIGREVLSELDWFDQGFKVSGATADVRNEQLRRESEPFVGWVRTMESVDDGPEVERIYLVCRGHTPLNFEPTSGIATFANYRSDAGRIASIDPGNDITITLPRNKGRKTIRVVEKDSFLPIKGRGSWDARNNQFAFHLDDEYVYSLRAALGVEAALPIPEVPQPEAFPVVEGPDGRATLDELRRLEEETKRLQQELNAQKLHRVREIVESIALKDQPILDAAQDEFCRRPLKSQIVLSGSPGTGKTTSIIKRIAMKADELHLRETDEIELPEAERSNWLIFTPNDLLKIYLKEAMNKEGLTATDQFVSTWERERGILGRDVLGFLKRGDKGIFGKTDAVLLSDPSSVATSRIALEFLAFFDQEFVTALRLAIRNLSDAQIGPDILTSETFPIAEKFRRFVANCVNLERKLDSGSLGAEGVRSLASIEELSMLATGYSEARTNADQMIAGLVDSWIQENPTRFEDIVEFVSSSDREENIPPSDDLEGTATDGLEEITPPEIAADPRLLARNKIRQVIASQSEAMATGKHLRGDAQFISDYIGISDSASNEMVLAGKLRIALKPGILRVNSFNRLLSRIPRSFQRFRLSELRKPDVSNYRPESHEPVGNLKVSPAEVDILIFSMLRIASLARERRSSLLEPELHRELLGRIADQYRTHIAVDEATDFSAIQLASIFYLTDPRYRAVTFSGDLMQRVTTAGISDWSELQQLVPSVERFELIASYRQTPTLLEIAKKLYTNIIGEEPRFDSKHSGKGNFPSPLRYSGVFDEKLATWLAERVYEIYRINGETMPSIAIFVPSESDIDPAYSLLKEALNEYSIDVEACKLGKILGTSSNIRIFSIEFIKGLEFEGVFYIDIDRSYEFHPQLVDKYLYVGLTRATTFLGVTYSTKLPKTFEFLDVDLVRGDWKAFL